jgi:putative FmdB family regulatory protein
MCPIYEYFCEECPHEFELRQKMDAEPVAPCPLCEKDSDRVSYPGCGFRIHGVGVYNPSIVEK